MEYDGFTAVSSPEESSWASRADAPLWDKTVKTRDITIPRGIV